MTQIATTLLRLMLNLIWFIASAGALVFVCLVVLGFLALRGVFIALWWVFTLPGRVLEGKWSKS